MQSPQHGARAESLYHIRISNRVPASWPTRYQILHQDDRGEYLVIIGPCRPYDRVERFGLRSDLSQLGPGFTSRLFTTTVDL